MATGNSHTSFKEWLLSLAINKTMGNFLSPTQIHTIMSKLEEFGSTAIALGTTAMSIYTGLKGFLS
jgi:hypothetical protein